jgi:hypothetical protein
MPTLNNPTLAPLPVAWIGYARTDTVRVCAWCPDKMAADKLALAQGFRVTHQICPVCYNKQLAELLGEKDPHEN